MKKYFLLSFFLLLVNGIEVFAQNEKTIVRNRKYVRMNIGHNGLHCPFLGPKLETAIKNIQGAEDLKMDKVNSFLTFTLPANNTMTPEELKLVGTKAGYPADDVSVITDIKPFANTEKRE